MEVIDLRSDTVTTPTQEMRVAMMEAAVGDDVFEDDPTVNELEKKAGVIFGKENALFVPSGTMGNLISVMVHCSRRGDEVLIGDQSHITTFEQGGVASLGGVHPMTVKTLSNGTLDLEDLESKIRLDDVHYPRTRLVCIENTHNLRGGRPINLAYMKDLTQLIHKHGLKLHVDGARIFNASVALNVPVALLVEGADSVSCCLSKGLGAPVGSVIAGSSDFIRQARRLRKALGGGMRQCGILAAPGLIALESMSQRLQVDHDNAKLLAYGIAKLQHLGLKVDVDSVETNMVYFMVCHPSLTAAQVVQKLDTCAGDTVRVRVTSPFEKCIRAVTHHQVTQEGIELSLRKLKQVLEE
jgi:threonine aldolase